MKKYEGVEAYPLSWPTGWPREGHGAGMDMDKLVKARDEAIRLCG